jgi:hypothetical protein
MQGVALVFCMEFCPINQRILDEVFDLIPRGYFKKDPSVFFYFFIKKNKNGEAENRPE